MFVKIKMILKSLKPVCCVVDCCEIFLVEFQRVIAAFCLLTVLDFNCIAFVFDCTSHFVCFALKMTTMASFAAEITAGMKIKYVYIYIYIYIYI